MAKRRRKKAIKGGYFTKKQVKALNRSFERNGESKLRKAECRKVNNRGVIVCRNAKGHYLASRSSHIADRWS